MLLNIIFNIHINKLNLFIKKVYIKYIKHLKIKFLCFTLLKKYYYNKIFISIPHTKIIYFLYIILFLNFKISFHDIPYMSYFLSISQHFHSFLQKHKLKQLLLDY